MAKIFDTLRLSSDQLDQLVEELQRPTERATDSKRENRRWSAGAVRMVVTTTDASGQVTRQLGAMRNLSSSGAAVIIGTFVYPGTECILSVKNLVGEVRHLSGRVEWCRHVRSRVHDVGISFKEVIHPREFIEFGDGNVFDTEYVDLKQLKGRVLVIEESRADQKLIAHYFRDSELEVDYAQDGEGGLMMLGEHPDMVFVCDTLRDMSGVDVISNARRNGYGGPIVMLTADSRSDARESAIEAGANELLVKPFAPELIHQAAAEYLLRQATRDSEIGRIESTVDPEIISTSLVCEYIDGLVESSEELADAIEKNEIDRLRELLQRIKSSSGSYGLEPISMIASKAIEQIEETKSIEQSMMEVQRLIGACQRVIRPDAEASGSSS